MRCFRRWGRHACKRSVFLLGLVSCLRCLCVPLVCAVPCTGVWWLCLLAVLPCITRVSRSCHWFMLPCFCYVLSASNHLAHTPNPATATTPASAPSLRHSHPSHSSASPHLPPCPPDAVIFFCAGYRSCFIEVQPGIARCRRQRAGDRYRLMVEAFRIR